MEAGNFEKQIDQNKYIESQELQDDKNDYHTFDTHICPDGYPYMFFEDDDGREPGFFFSVSGIP